MLADMDSDSDSDDDSNDSQPEAEEQQQSLAQVFGRAKLDSKVDAQMQRNNEKVLAQVDNE